MKIRHDYGGGTFWLNIETTPVAGAWAIGKRADQNPALKNLGLHEWNFGASNWAVYHTSGLVAGWFRGRKQAYAAALAASIIWNGEKFDDSVPLETRNKIYRLFQSAPGKIA